MYMTKKSNPYKGEYIYETVSWEYRSKDLMIHEKNLFKLLYTLITIRSKDMWGRIIDWCNLDFNRRFGEGTKYDLDYGKLLIIGLCIYIAIKVS